MDKMSFFILKRKQNAVCAILVACLYDRWYLSHDKQTYMHIVNVGALLYNSYFVMFEACPLVAS